VSDSGLLKVLPAIARLFVAAEVRHFPSAEKEQSLTWLEAAC
jgi:hypothetical protein